MAVEIHPQSGALGAEIRGIDLGRGWQPGDIEAIRQALLEYQVVFLRGQQLSHARYSDFAGELGPLQDYMFADGVDGYPFITEIVKTENERESFGSFWHSDSAYIERPPKYTLLYAREVPPRGGDTLFADTCGAYDELSAGLKQALADLRAINSASVVPRDEDIYAAVKSKNADRRLQQAIHPVVRTHAESGRRALYVNGIHTLAIDGWTREESLPLLRYLCARIERPEYTWRLRWQADTLAIWDNRCTQHYALNDYHGYRREMHRIIVQGERPE